MSFKGKKITIMGLGLHGGGVGSTKFFYKKGAEVTVTDIKTKEELKSSLRKLKGLPINYTLSEHKKEDFTNADLIIKNPGVSQSSPYLKLAENKNIPIETATTIFFKLCLSEIIGITGTKGKSTVATLIYRFLKTEYENTVLAGNIGVSPLQVLDKTDKKTKVVLELSSFNLEDLEKSPQVALITNIYKDHLNRYKNMKEYIGAKAPIFKNQTKKDILVLNYNNQKTRSFAPEAKGKVYFFSLTEKNKNKEGEVGCFLKNGQIFFSEKQEPVLNLRETEIKGEHNISNLLAAVTLAKIFKVPSKNIKESIKSFKGVPEREQQIATKNGIRFFDDTTATIPEAAQVTISVLKEKNPKSRIFLIGGGVDKNLDYKDFTLGIKEKIENILLLPGTASNKIKRAFAEKKTEEKIIQVSSMKEAVKKAYNLAKKEDIILLSPAAASFNLFKNEFDRGEQFKEAINNL